MAEKKPVGVLYAVVMWGNDQPEFSTDTHGGCIMHSKEMNVYTCAISWSGSTLTKMLPDLKSQSPPQFHGHTVVRFNVRGAHGTGDLHFVVIYDQSACISRSEAWWLPAKHSFPLRKYFRVGSEEHCITERLDPEHFDTYVPELGC